MSWYYRLFRIIRRRTEYTYSDLLPYSIGNTNSSWDSWEWWLTTHLLAGYCGMGLTKENLHILSQFLDNIICGHVILWMKILESRVVHIHTGTKSSSEFLTRNIEPKRNLKIFIFSISGSDLQSCSKSARAGVLLPHWAGLKLGSSRTPGRCPEVLELSYGCRNCHAMGLCVCSSRIEKALRERREASAPGAKSKERLFPSLSIKLKYTLFLCIYYFRVEHFLNSSTSHKH